jgi:hypothetical protein
MKIHGYQSFSSLRTAVLIAAFSFIIIQPQNIFAQTLDPFGGYASIPVKGGATGSFRVGQLGDKWVLVTPDGNAFWMRGVADITGNVSPSQEAAILAKYGKAWWTSGGPFFQQAIVRLRSWGMNTIGEYSAPLAWPDPNPDSMPFIQILNPSGTGLDSNAITNAAGGTIKDLIDGTETSIYTGYRSTFPDVFDPKFPKIIEGCLQANGVVGNPALTRWLLGTIPDDRDLLLGFGTATAHPHLGWIVAVTAPSRTSSVAHDVQYTDTTAYSKLAWENYLQTKYKTIGVLNAAWHSSYTTFGSDGGWPNGKGLLDESGHNAWIGTNYLQPSGPSIAVRTDLDSFLSILSEKYFAVTDSVVHAALPNKLIIGPADVCVETRPQILRAEGKYVDILAVAAAPDSLAIHPNLACVYAIAKKPMFCETYLTANQDSPLAQYAGETGADYTTQELRGAAYAECVSGDLASRGADGMCPAVGCDWWAWTDSPGEEKNFGLVTNIDNAYDGVEDQISAGKDQWGYTTGGEAKNYGDLLTQVTKANASVYDSLLKSANAGVTPTPLARGGGASSAMLGVESVHPNPAGSTTDIDFELYESGTVNILLVASSGVTVQSMDYQNLSAGPHTISINTSCLPTGAYMLRVESDGQAAIVPLAILR